MQRLGQKRKGRLMKNIYLLPFFLLAILCFSGCFSVGTWTQVGYQTRECTERKFVVNESKTRLDVDMEIRKRRYYVPFDFCHKIPNSEWTERQSASFSLLPEQGEVTEVRIPCTYSEKGSRLKPGRYGLLEYRKTDYEKDFPHWKSYPFEFPGVLDKMTLHPEEKIFLGAPFIYRGSSDDNHFVLIPWKFEDGILSCYLPAYQSKLPSYCYTMSGHEIDSFGCFAWRCLWTPAALVVDVVTLPVQVGGFIYLMVVFWDVRM